MFKFKTETGNGVSVEEPSGALQPHPILSKPQADVSSVASVKLALVEHWSNAPMLVELGKACKRAALTIEAFARVEIAEKHAAHKEAMAKMKAQVEPWNGIFWQITERLAIMDASEAKGGVPVAPTEFSGEVEDWPALIEHIKNNSDYSLVTLNLKEVKARHKKLGNALAIPGIKIG